MRLIIALAILLVFATPASAQGPVTLYFPIVSYSPVNLVSNPGFEQGLTGWSTQSVITAPPAATDTYAYSGTYSLGLTETFPVGLIDSLTPPASVYSSFIPIVPNQLYRASVWTKIVTNNREVSASLCFYDAHPSLLDCSTISDYGGTTDWDYQSVTVLAPPTAVAAQVRLYWYAVEGQNTEAYFDDVSLTPL